MLNKTNQIYMDSKGNLGEERKIKWIPPVAFVLWVALNVMFFHIIPRPIRSLGLWAIIGLSYLLVAVILPSLISQEGDKHGRVVMLYCFGCDICLGLALYVFNHPWLLD
jgi:hypothetical protein